jgi:hypothetical protein
MRILSTVSSLSMLRVSRSSCKLTDNWLNSEQTSILLDYVKQIEDRIDGMPWKQKVNVIKALHEFRDANDVTIGRISDRLVGAHEAKERLDKLCELYPKVSTNILS